MQAIKTCADQLAALGKNIEHEDLIDRVLLGLHESYNSVIESVNARDSPISFEELHEKLINKELSINQNRSDPTLPATAFVATARSHHHQNRPHTRNNATPGILPSLPNTTYKPRPFLGKCQWCREQGHVVSQCPSFKQQFPNVTPPNPPHNINYSNPKTSKPQAHSATVASPSTSSPWLLDSGASHHVTMDLDNLSLHAPYDGTEELIIGDGTGLKISHIGSLSFSYLSSSIKLNNVLCVPALSRNIISISQLCIDNNVSVEFLPNSFIVKDLKTGESLFQGPVKSGIYEVQSIPPQVFSSTKASSLDWHHRLGHPSYRVFRQIISKNKLHVSSMSTLDCTSCACNKSHQLPFSISTITFTAPLQYIYTDLWTSPIYSHDGYKYYVIFVDHYTKYTWLYPLKQKSETKNVFIRYKALVEKYFQLPLVTLYSDNGGEYETLKTYLAIDGISRLTTPPHTPQHNGYSERRHRHIVETFLSLLTHTNMPLEF